LFGSETLLLPVAKRPSTAGNFDDNHKSLQLMPNILAACDQSIDFVKSEVGYSRNLLVVLYFHNSARILTARMKI